MLMYKTILLCLVVFFFFKYGREAEGRMRAMNINLVLTICIFEPLASGSHANSLLGRFGLETQCSDTLSTSAVFVMKLCRVTRRPGGVCEVTWE